MLLTCAWKKNTNFIFSKSQINAYEKFAPHPNIKPVLYGLAKIIDDDELKKYNWGGLQHKKKFADLKTLNKVLFGMLT